MTGVNFFYPTEYCLIKHGNSLYFINRGNNAFYHILKRATLFGEASCDYLLLVRRLVIFFNYLVNELKHYYNYKPRSKPTRHACCQVLIATPLKSEHGDDKASPVPCNVSQPKFVKINNCGARCVTRERGKKIIIILKHLSSCASDG